MDIGTALSGGGAEITYPASLAQTRFWLLDALDPGTPALNVAVRWSLLGPITHAAVEAAFRTIVSRHEILRTALSDIDGTPVQIVRPVLPFKVHHHDLTALKLAESLAEADRIGEEEARTPFILESAPLIRVALISLAPENARLLLTMHHAVCDGWSVGIVADELTRALSHAPNLPDLVLQYGDYAEWQQAWLQSKALTAASSYWTSHLAGLPYVTVPPDRAAEERGAGTIRSILLPRELTDAMAATAASHGCTPFAVALAALGRMLQTRTGADDIPIGTQIAGRTEVELEGMIGPFINTLVLRLALSGSPDWAERVDRAATVVADALQHHAMPFELLIRALNPPRSRGRTPLFSVNFIFQRSFVAPFADERIQLVDLPSHSAGALYDLNFFMVERPDGWRASCEYDAARFNGATVDAMLAEWQQALSGKAIVPAEQADPVLDRLAVIWCETLGVAGVSPSDGFFDLGGHSLLAARMLARVEAVFGQRIGMAAMFADSTLGGLAARLAPPPATSGPPLVAVGDGADWQAFGQAIGATYDFTRVADATPAAVTQRYPAGPITILGVGKNGPAALSLAQSLELRGWTVTLALIDAALPETRRKLWPLRRPVDPVERFTGRTLLFARAGSANPIAGWSVHLAGEVEQGVLPAGSWYAHVAQRLGTAPVN